MRENPRDLEVLTEVSQETTEVLLSFDVHSARLNTNQTLICRVFVKSSKLQKAILIPLNNTDCFPPIK